MRARALIAFVTFVVLSQLLDGGTSWLVFTKLHLIEIGSQPFRPSLIFVLESITAAAALIATLAAGAIQRRGFAGYGFGGAAAGRRMLAGSAWGLGAVCILVAAIAALGGFTLGHLAWRGSAILGYSAAWLATMFMLGLAEEATFRATAMFTLADVISPWPAAIATTLVFAALHYFGKPNENIADALSVGLIGLFVAFTVLRTGSIWWAVGFHALFDYAALFIFGTPNTAIRGGEPVPTKLLTSAFHGPQWLTGGRTGIEASWLVFPIIAVLFVGFDRVYRARH